MNEISLWTTELGIVGLTVSSLVSLLFYVVISSNSREDKRTQSFQKTIADIHTMHKDERTEWKNDANERQSQTNEAIKELSKTIHEVAINRT